MNTVRIVPPSVQMVSAADLVSGDTLVNLGQVMSIHPVGAFYVVSYISREWLLTTGRPQSVTKETTMHAADDVAVLR